MKRILWIVLAIALLAGVGYGEYFYWKNLRGAGPVVNPPPQDVSQIIKSLKLPQDFSISIFAKDLTNPRDMVWDPAGNLILSITSVGRVVALPDKNRDGVADETKILVSGLDRPHGLAFYCPLSADGCKLYIAEAGDVLAYDYDEENLTLSNRRKILDLPADGGHFTRSLLFLPPPNQGELLISVGSSCNVCNEPDGRRAKILIVNYDGSDLKTFASGLRNSVFMALQPKTQKVWATEMGRDYLGDDLPPDEINIIDAGKNFGWPNCYGNNIHDTDFDHNTYVRNPCMAPFETSSYFDIPAHSAPLGLAFIPANAGWPVEYANNLLVAFHGSWNKSTPTGYKVVRYKINEDGSFSGNAPAREDFITGWLEGNGALGRPADLLFDDSGALYISDDKAGVIYILKYDKSKIIEVSAPQPNTKIKSPLTVLGEARGNWFFEATFPVKLLDGKGKVIAERPAQAEADWMTDALVPFKAVLKFTAPKTATGTLVLSKDNPSGLPENAEEIRIPIRFK